MSIKLQRPLSLKRNHGFPYKILVSTLIFGLCCVSCQSKKTRTTHSILHINMCSGPSSLDPRQARLVRDLTLMRQLYEGLFRITNNGVEPALATHYTLSEDGCHYTFFLREAYWSNGNPITADDFVHSWTQTLSPDFPSAYSYLLYPIRNGHAVKLGQCSVAELGVRAVDAHTLEVELEQPLPYFLELTAFPTWFPVHPLVDQSQTPIVSGPFSLKEWKPEDHLTLSRNTSYWDQSHVYLDEVDVSFIQDVQTEHHLFSQGLLDWLGAPISHDLPPEILARWKEKSVAHSYDVDGTLWFKVNTRATPLQNTSLRKALSAALSRQDFVTYLTGGGQKIATSILPPSLQLHAHTLLQDNAPDVAKRYLNQACQEEGWTIDTLPTITLSYPASERNTKIVQVAQAQWKERLGLHVKLEALERGVFYAKTRAGAYQLGIGEWIADYHDPIAFLELFQGTLEEGSGINDTGWSDPRYRTCIALASQTSSLDERARLLMEAEALVMDRLPVIPLYHYAFDYVSRSHLSGVFLSPLGTMDFKSARIEQTK